MLHPSILEFSRGLIGQRIRPFVTIYLFMLASLFVLRLLLILFYSSQFDGLGVFDMLRAFLHGLRFDISIVTLLFSPVLLALLVPLHFAIQPAWQRFWLTLGLVPCLLIVALGLGSLAYFGEVRRHLGSELVFLTDDWPLLLELVVSSRLVQGLLAILFLLMTAFCWRLWVVPPSNSRRLARPTSLTAGWVALLVLLPVLVLAARGGVLDGKTLNIIDAYALGSDEEANIALNAAFTVVHATRNLSGAYEPLMAAENELLLRQEHGIAKTNPFLQQHEKPYSRGKNVVVILLESWSYNYIDALAGQGYGATPNLDALIAESRVYDQHFAAGQRSIQGIQAILTGVPVLPGQPRLSEGLELVDMSRLGHLAAQEGYQSLMLQSSTRRSFRMDSIAASLGFDHYYGQEDLPLLREYPQPTPRFGWDYEALMHFHSKLNDLAHRQQPFFGFVFTGTTHEPFADPGADFHLRPHDHSGENGFINTLYYSDWALGQFMAAARDSSWFDDTVFVITADHVLRAESNDLREQFRVPLLVYAPGFIEPGRSQQVVSQYDMMPTFLDLMGVTEPFVAFGESLFRDELADEAWVIQGDVLGIIREDASIMHSLRDRLELTRSDRSSISAESFEERLLLLSHIASEKLSANHWLKGTESNHLILP
ncbi:MAG: sulfatase [Gammaproteobacteria bacterium HGW-Gammaproteobacteria-11]|nr:MAG: sulfatase [Gammaproteobacteria bacterium HGW-Gammaproteobacteria-11]